jgi:hypothetical protein
MPMHRPKLFFIIFSSIFFLDTRNANAYQFFLLGSVILYPAGFCYRQVTILHTTFTRHHYHNFPTVSLEQLILLSLCVIKLRPKNPTLWQDSNPGSSVLVADAVVAKNKSIPKIHATDWELKIQFLVFVLISLACVQLICFALDRWNCSSDQLEEIRVRLVDPQRAVWFRWTRMHENCTTVTCPPTTCPPTTCPLTTCPPTTCPPTTRPPTTCPLV